jgi:hypothetical protein
MCIGAIRLFVELFLFVDVARFTLAEITGKVEEQLLVKWTQAQRRWCG